MKPSKAHILLYCLEKLMDEGRLEKRDLLRLSPISEPTFTRYIQEIRAYLYNTHPGSDLEYHKWEDAYVLVPPNALNGK